ncbi:glycoside hydrolase family 2 protein [Simiduia sp. 21SJ11W-1]|uniref:glycoside hydrolase family 2 protein n=1 Tax=Simiduia sp. 21SJ11W-1 TaxID=2909669 RepID=UPI00209FC7D8|nr:glycoside hydrolase family 2 TIM barrel-domain containing protein [Simiduia sp. 21SJ11W-1]UTA48655.1 glycoside hydrolase family 2 protein [Simiduia sp. 21SJ11W-1]
MKGKMHHLRNRLASLLVKVIDFCSPRLTRCVVVVGLISLCACLAEPTVGRNHASAGTGPVEISVAWGERTNFNDHWRYAHANAPSPNAKALATVTQWQPVTLPHTWNATDTVDPTPGYRRATGWYQKTFTVSEAGHYRLHFEAANMETQIYLNGHMIGEHVGGYVGFKQSLNKHLKVGEPNTLLVSVSNRYNPDVIPSQKADFFIHGGLTRDVWLERLPDYFIERALITTPVVSKAEAHTHVAVQLAGKVQPADLLVTLKNAEGEALVSEQVLLPAGGREANIQLPVIESPQLWSPASPYLYTLSVTLLDADGVAVHSQSHPVGFRWFEMRDGEGFFLNGERLLLRGTHRHEEHAGVGAAMSNAQHRADMAQMKALGVNFVRLAHYPQDPEVYRAADELGLILWDELPWCRGGKGGALWEQNTERLLEAQILQNYNHPSIMFWSLGNEIYWESDFPGGGEDSIILPYLEKLHSKAKKLDPHRYTAIRKYYPGAQTVDVFSPSIWAGWYGGAYGQYQAAISKAMKDYPRFLHMEYGASSHRGRHTEQPYTEAGMPNEQLSVAEAMNQAGVTSIARDSDWNETYAANLFDWHLSVSESQQGFGGNAQWAFKDFGTPLRPENPLPYVNQKGLVDRQGRPKDAYYVFASYWSESPFCYIASHTWPVRYGPPEGREVKVYCNTHSAELTLNGKTLGKKQRTYGQYPAHGLVWQVPFNEGENQLQVAGFSREGERLAADSLQVKYHIGVPGKLERVVLTALDLGEGNWQIDAEALDEKGRRVVTFSDRAYFSVLNGDATLWADQGTYDGASIIEMANGVASIKVRAGRLPSTIELRTQDVKGVFVQLPPQAAR